MKSWQKFGAFILLACAVQALGQNQAQSKIVPVIAEHESEKHVVLQDGNSIDRVQKGMFYRDSQGRTRMETGRVVVINDPVAGVTYLLDTEKKIAHKTEHQKIRLQAAAPTSQITKDLTSNAGRPSAETKELGERMIDGVLCEGKQVATEIPVNVRLGNRQPIKSKMEVWMAKDLHLPVLMMADNPLSGKSIQRFKNIRRGVEPDPNLFRVPDGWQVLEQ